MSKITMRNNEVTLVVDFLMELELPARDSRLRTRFVRQLQEHYNNIVTEEREQLIEEFAKKDENGERVLETRKNDKGEEVQVMLLDDPEAFNKEMTELLMEKYVIAADENNEKMLKSVTNAILNYDGVLSGVKALQYDRICEIFEDLEELE